MSLNHGGMTERKKQTSQALKSLPGLERGIQHLQHAATARPTMSDSMNRRNMKEPTASRQTFVFDSDSQESKPTGGSSDNKPDDHA